MQLKRKSDRLGTEAIVPLLFKLSIPSIIAMATQALYNVIDSIYVARLSTDALSALSLTFPVQMIIIAIAVGTGVGTSSLISRLLGKGDKSRATNAAEHVIIISVIYGIILAIAGILFSSKIIQLFVSDENLIAMGTEYISIIMVGSIALFFPMISNNILRGQGNTIAPMIAMMAGAIINIIIDPLFIFGIGFFPKWGVGGAAFATVLARLLSGGFLIFILFSDKNELNLNLKNFKYDFTIVKEIYQVGFPAMVMQFLASFMLSGMNIILASFNSTAIAAAGLYFRLQSFVFMPVFGLNQGYIPLMGYNYGHNKPERMKKAMKSAFLIAFGFTMTGFFVFQLLTTNLITLFNKDPELIRIGTTALKTISLAFPIIGPAIIISTTFQAIGRGLPSLIISFFRQIAILLPLMYFLGKFYGLNMIWFAFPIAELISNIPAAIWLTFTMKKIFTSMCQKTEKNRQSIRENS